MFNWRNVNFVVKKLSRLLLPRAVMIEKPVVVVLGCTGAGKSKLALEIASKIEGEIISADSMQIYTGLDIVTNKVTQEELSLVTHHMINIVNPLSEKYSVIDFTRTALSIIDDIHKKSKVPVIVGGTNYYIESLLFDLTLKTNMDDASDEISEEVRTKYKDATNDAIWEELRALDSNYAVRLHPNDRRKVLRAIEVCRQTGSTMTAILEQQHAPNGSSMFSGPMRFQPCLLWVTCGQEQLDERTDKRVDDMMQKGLLQELLAFHDEFNAKRVASANGVHDYTHGIFQTIGFKEFHDYLLCEDRESARGQALLRESVDAMKRTTRRYARSQVRWLRGRFMRAGRPSAAVYCVDSTDVSQWSDKVREPALEVVHSYLRGEEPRMRPMPRDQPELVRMRRECALCEMIFTTEALWDIHVKSKRHKHALNRQRVERKLEENRRKGEDHKRRKLQEGAELELQNEQLQLKESLN